MQNVVRRARESRLILATIILVLVFVILVGVIFVFFLGDRYGVEHMTFKQITPDQAASAMQGDHFYSDYRENTLLVAGTVESTSSTDNGLLVTFNTTSSFKATCQFNANGTQIHPGETITAITEGATAVRQTNAVLLKNCIFP